MHSLRPTLPFLFPALLAVLTDGSPAAEFSSRHHSYHATTILSGLKSPWAVEPAPDGRLFITEKAGQIVVVDDARIVARLSGIPGDLAVVGQGGLLDIAFDPAFEKTHFVYICYTTRKNAVPQEGTNTRLSRFRLDGAALREEKILVQGGYGTDGAHFGCRVAFAKDGRLHGVFGERHNKEKAQDLRFLNGKTIRINADGSIPRDNPFLGTPGALPQIFTLGHRNPQGLDIHPESGVPVVSEHGPTGYDAQLPGFGPVGKADEVNWLLPGANYGWPLVFGDPGVLPWTREMKELVASGKVRMPVKEFSVPDGIAPSGASFYKGDLFPKWKFDFFVTALRGYLVRLKISPVGQLLEEEKIVPGGYGRFRDVATGKRGELLAITDAGELVRIDPNGTGVAPPPAPEESPLFPAAREAFRRNACLDCHGFLRTESSIPAHWKGPDGAGSAIWRVLATNRMPIGRAPMPEDDKRLIRSWLDSPPPQ